jgi:hypothetical protein
MITIFLHGIFKREHLASAALGGAHRDTADPRPTIIALSFSEMNPSCSIASHFDAKAATDLRLAFSVSTTCQLCTPAAVQ